MGTKSNNDPSQEAPELDHVIHMRETCRFNVTENFNYAGSGVLHTFNYIVVRILAQIILHIYNFTFLGMKIKGRRNVIKLHGKGAVIVCNHVHPMDCTVIDCAIPLKRIYYTTLEANFRIPLIRHIIRALGGVPIPKSPHRLKEMMDQMNALLKRGKCVCMYPEGVLVPYCEYLRKFHDGAFRLSAESGAPLVPAVVTFRKPGWPRSLFRKRPCLTLNILEPLVPDEDVCMRERTQKLREECFERMESAVEENGEWMTA
ncbi:MAG TPA: lysophospholipid acyltransferase family protein [Bacillota bacterium]|nr:lysophospholipid acyltransferase family protein [Bacillota bacterium]